jgi:hypothetical protein
VRLTGSCSAYISVVGVAAPSDGAPATDVALDCEDAFGGLVDDTTMGTAGTHADRGMNAGAARCSVEKVDVDPAAVGRAACAGLLQDVEKDGQIEHADPVSARMYGDCLTSPARYLQVVVTPWKMFAPA